MTDLAPDGYREPERVTAPARTSVLRVAVSVLLVACYATACAWSLWSRAHAVEFFALASVAAAGFVSAGAAGRVVAGVLADLLAGTAAVTLPVLGDVADAAAAALAVVLMSGKFLRLARTLPFGVACLGLYLGLWSLAGRLPLALRPGTGHGVRWLEALAAVLLAAAGALYLLVVAQLARWAGAERTTAVLRTVGFPWMLLMFVVTWFVPDKSGRAG